MSELICQALIRSGPNKGTRCKNYAKIEKDEFHFCYNHKNAKGKIWDDNDDNVPEISIDTDNEQWSDISNFPGYKVSTFGRLMTKFGKISQHKSRTNGYVHTTLIDKNGLPKTAYLHVLIALIFIPNSNPDQKIQVNHINAVRDDNRVVNLEWTTRKENCRHRHNPKTGHGRTVCQYKDGELVATYNSATEASNITGLSRANIGEVARHHQFRSGGFEWYFLDQIDELEENWKPIVVNGATIQVSSIGRIRLQTGKIVFGYKNLENYRFIGVKERHYSVHRLVCRAFKWFEGCENLTVNHIDKNRSNNRVDNLEWLSRKDNTRHAIARAVDQFTQNGDFIRRYSCMNDVQLTIPKVRPSDIRQVCLGKASHAGGFLWRYVDNNDSDDRYDDENLMISIDNDHYDDENLMTLIDSDDSDDDDHSNVEGDDDNLPITVDDDHSNVEYNNRR